MIITRTQKELASYLGVTPEYLNEIKGGRKNLHRKRYLKLISFYNEKKIAIDKIIVDLSSQV